LEALKNAAKAYDPSHNKGGLAFWHENFGRANFDKETFRTEKSLGKSENEVLRTLDERSHEFDLHNKFKDLISKGSVESVIERELIRR
jgi:hypothetical protein